MGALAIYTDTPVYAADRIQYDNPTNDDFGAWEGTLYRFPPSGAPASVVSRPPVEFRDLTSVF